MKLNLKHLSEHVFLFGMVLLLAYTSYIGIKNIFRYNGFKLEYQAKLDAFNVETKLNQRYRTQLLLMDRPEFWENEAKTRLGFVHPGETVYKPIYQNELNDDRAAH
ncbi:MAG: septum formation initiator family protein [Candidatus Margulisiibacteriota bacterium]